METILCNSGWRGGMEYAMCTMITGERPYPSLLGNAHELAHAWFQHLLATNEAKHPWMDEGFTEYITHLAEESVMEVRFLTKAAMTGIIF